MILVTGGTGFIGQVLVRHLVEEGHTVRTLLRPAPGNPRLPAGVPVQVAISSIDDARGMRSALTGIETVIHLAGSEWRGARADLDSVEVAGARTLAAAAGEAGVRRIIAMSHLGADRASAYPVLKANGIAEELLRKTGLDVTIVRAAPVFGPDDHFTTAIARILHIFPFVFPLPGRGQMLLQPLWVEDLATCLAWLLERPESAGQTYELGGPEFLTLADIVNQVMGAVGVRRRFWPLSPVVMRYAAVYLEYFFPGIPTSTYWLDYFSASHTTEIDSVPRQFGLLPARLSQRLGHLHGQPWGRRAWRDLFVRPRQ
ncbi:MAG: NAD-dependent epimerase/dehydratase family protein [Anaerolineae bacterium]|nr:MAG: NAD-dependent epimerase/dehydratase family protein [Anaerolineae bacterium]